MFKELYPYHSHACLTVSILVIQEVVFKGCPHSLPFLSIHSFNPCHSGSCVQRTNILKYISAEPSFNPCHSGSCVQSITFMLPSLVSIKFQSLSFRKLCSKNLFPLQGHHHTHVSILVIQEVVFKVSFCFSTRAL